MTLKDLYIYIFRNDLINIPKGLCLTSDPEVESQGKIERQCGPGANVQMTIEMKNESDDSDIIVFKRFIVLWDTGIFKIQEKGRGGRLQYVRRNRHLKKGS